jgi:hypothetical protein
VDVLELSARVGPLDEGRVSREDVDELVAVPGHFVERCESGEQEDYQKDEVEDDVEPERTVRPLERLQGRRRA